MRISILFVLSFWLSVGICQEQKIGFGLTLFPNISNGFISSKDTNSNFYTGTETSVFSYSLGFEVDYYFKNGWGISSGVRFQKVGDRSKPFPPDLNRGLIYERNYTHKHYYLDFPIEGFKIINEKWMITLGASALFKLWDRGLLFSGGGSGIKIDAQTYSTGKFGISGNFGLGYSLNFDNTILKILPYTQFNFAKPLEDVPSIDILPARYYASFGFQVSYILIR